MNLIIGRKNMPILDFAYRVVQEGEGIPKEQPSTAHSTFCLASLPLAPGQKHGAQEGVVKTFNFGNRDKGNHWADRWFKEEKGREGKT